MPPADLPEDGPLQLGAVRLPAGSCVIPWEGPGEPAAWVTEQPVPDPGPVWSALSDMHHDTGLVPILLDDQESEERFFFLQPSDVAELDDLDAAQLLAMMWHGKTADDHDPWPRAVEPFARHFPGLAHGQDGRLSMAQLHDALASLPAARIGLVPVRRPADVLPVVGWSTFDDPAYEPIPNCVLIAAVLRSWEDRFGARLLNLGPRSEIRLLVERPPRSIEAAQPIAAEHFAFATECDGCGSLSHVSRIAAAIVNAPIWTFWWD